MSLFRPLLIALGMLVVAGAACGSGDGETDTAAGAGAPRIVVGSKLDTEARLLAELTAQVLEAAGYEVRRQIPTGPTDITRRALLSGHIDVYWEFTGTGLTLLGEEPIGDPAAAYDAVKALDTANGVTWLPAAAMNDTYALAVNGDGGPVPVTTLSELAGVLAGRPGLRLCVDPEGGFRSDVLPPLREVYGIEFANQRQLTSELIPPAVAAEECDVGVVYSTAALVAKSGLRVLTDDRAAFGAYTPAPTVRTDRLARWPNLAADLAGLTAALDTPAITRLNAEVDIDGVPVAEVARQFLAHQRLDVRRAAASQQILIAERAPRRRF